MIRAQQESIDSLKQMLAQLLEDKRKSTDKTSSKKSKGKGKEGESSSSIHIEEKEQPISGSSKSSSQGKDDRDQGRVHSKRMNQLKQRLEAFTNRKGLQEVGVVRPYPTEWDLVHTLPSSRLRPSKHLMGKVHRTNISTTLSLKQGMW